MQAPHEKTQVTCSPIKAKARSWAGLGWWPCKRSGYHYQATHIWSSIHLFLRAASNTTWSNMNCLPMDNVHWTCKIDICMSMCTHDNCESTCITHAKTQAKICKWCGNTDRQKQTRMVGKHVEARGLKREKKHVHCMWTNQLSYLIKCKLTGLQSDKR